MKVNLVSLIKIKVSLLKQLVGVELRIAIEVLRMDRNLVNFNLLLLNICLQTCLGV